MDLLQWQQTDKDQFAVFIRDLTQNLNNVKHMIEDSLKKPQPKHPKKGKKSKKAKKGKTGRKGRKGKKRKSRRLTMRYRH